MKYFVKTRNWFCKPRILRLLSLMPHNRGDSYEDGDGKLYYESNNIIKAMAVFLYWKILSPLSGGETYIKNMLNA